MNYKLYVFLLLIFSIIIFYLWCNLETSNIPYNKLYKTIKNNQDKNQEKQEKQNNNEYNNENNKVLEGFEESSCDNKTDRAKTCVMLYKANGELTNVNENFTDIRKEHHEDFKYVDLLEDGKLSEEEIYLFLRDYKSNTLAESIDNNILADLQKINIDPEVQNLLDYNESVYKVYNKHSNTLEQQLNKLGSSQTEKLNNLLNKSENIRIRDYIKKYIYYNNLKTNKTN